MSPAPVMTPQQYCDPARFPHSTQVGLPPDKQMLIDSINYDDLAEYVRDGRPMSPAQQAVWAELQAKMPAREQVRAQLPSQPRSPAGPGAP